MSSKKLVVAIGIFVIVIVVLWIVGLLPYFINLIWGVPLRLIGIECGIGLDCSIALNGTVYIANHYIGSGTVHGLQLGRLYIIRLANDSEVWLGSLRLEIGHVYEIDVYKPRGVEVAISLRCGGAGLYANVTTNARVIVYELSKEDERVCVYINNTLMHCLTFQPEKFRTVYELLTHGGWYERKYGWIVSDINKCMDTPLALDVESGFVTKMGIVEHSPRFGFVSKRLPVKYTVRIVVRDVTKQFNLSPS